MLETIKFPAFDIFPSTESITVSPAQITESLAEIVASIKVTSTVSLALHPPSETVHEYVPFAVTVVVFVVPPLLHKYESYPLGAVNVVEVPQTVTSLPKSMVGLLTTTVTTLTDWLRLFTKIVNRVRLLTPEQFKQLVLLGMM